MIHPEDMTKVSITGPRSRMDRVVRELHRIGAFDITDYDGQYEDFEVGTPEEFGEELSAALVEIRSVLSRLPEVESDRTAEIEGLDKLRERVQDINDYIDTVEEDRRDTADRIDEHEQRLEAVEVLDTVGVDPSSFRGYDSLDTFVGHLEDHSVLEEFPEGRYEAHQHGDALVLFIDTGLDAHDELSAGGFQPLDHGFLIDEDQDTGELIQDLRETIDDLEADLEASEQEMESLAREHRAFLEANRDELELELEKVEAPLRFATTENAFIAEGWVPEDLFPRIDSQLEDVAGGKVAVNREEPEDDESAPVKHDNPGPVANFESLTDLMAVPKYNEIDPTFLLMLTFPLFFGYMIGDAGYGLTSFFVFYGAMKMFPEASDLFKGLMLASIATFGFGLAFGDAFGYIIFGETSVLAAVTGIELFRQIPILFHRSHNWSIVFYSAAAIGVAHINAGYLLGFYNELRNHGIVAAFLEKGSWILLEIAAVAWYLQGTTVGAPLMVLAVVLLFRGEGVEGVVEIPSLLSNILSYLRIFGVAVAAFSLAQVVNSMANPLYQMGTWYGLVGGTLVLMVGHIFNTFIKIMEGFLQGIRLHYVEMFGKFYEGGGRPYRPFGGQND